MYLGTSFNFMLGLYLLVVSSWIRYDGNRNKSGYLALASKQSFGVWSSYVLRKRQNVGAFSQTDGKHRQHRELQWPASQMIRSTRFLWKASTSEDRFHLSACQQMQSRSKVLDSIEQQSCMSRGYTTACYGPYCNDSN